MINHACLMCFGDEVNSWMGVEVAFAGSLPDAWDEASLAFSANRHPRSRAGVDAANVPDRGDLANLGTPQNYLILEYKKVS